MRTKRLLTVVVLLTVVLTVGLATAQAQTEHPAKGETRGQGVPGPNTFLYNGEALAPVKETEPNNARTEESANWIHEQGEFATRVHGVIEAGDPVDYYQFYGIAGDQLEVRVFASQADSDLDAELTLYNAAGSNLAYEDDCAPGELDPCLSYTLAGEGIYYLKVTDYDQEGGDSYWYDLFVWMPVRNNEWWYQYGPGDEEPNNTPATAYPLRYGRTLPWTQIDANGDIDYYKFDAKAGDQVRIRVETSGLRGTLDTQLALYNSAGVLQASCSQTGWPYNCFLEKVLTKAGVYTIKVNGAANDGGQRYWLQLGLWEYGESDDNVAEATGMIQGETMRGMVTAGDRCDVYSFWAEQHEYLTLHGPWLEMELLDNNGETIITNYAEFGLPISTELPYTGWYYASVCGYYMLDYTPFHYGDYSLMLDELMLTGVKTNIKVNGISYGMGDILAWLRHGGIEQYVMFFDGTDVGLKPTTNVMDFDVVQRYYYGADIPDYLLMAFKATTTLPAYPSSFKAAPQDIVKFVPYELGDKTNGYWEMYFDGSDIGLTTAAETIDAVEFVSSEYDYLYFSTTGRATVVPNRSGSTPFTAEDEDVIRCTEPSGGWNTVVGCSLFFDGSAAGIPATADVASYSDGYPRTEELYFTFTAATTINGVKYLPNEIAVCQPTTWEMPITSCAWSRYWMGNSHRLSGKFVDGLDAWMQPPY